MRAINLGRVLIGKGEGVQGLANSVVMIFAQILNKGLMYTFFETTIDFPKDR